MSMMFWMMNMQAGTFTMSAKDGRRKLKYPFLLPTNRMSAPNAESIWSKKIFSWPNNADGLERLP